MVVFPNCWVTDIVARAHRKLADDEPASCSLSGTSMSAFGGKADIGALSTFFNSEAVNRFCHHLIPEFLGVIGELP